MRLTLKSLVLAAAVALPAAAGATAAASAAGHALEAAPAKASVQVTDVQLARHSIRPVYTAGRCLLPRALLRVRHRNQLKRLGFHTVRYAGYFQVRHSCSQAIFFSACKRGIRYRADFRYRKGKLVSRSLYRAGHCPRIPLGPNKLKNPS